MMESGSDSSEMQPFPSDNDLANDNSDNDLANDTSPKSEEERPITAREVEVLVGSAVVTGVAVHHLPCQIEFNGPAKIAQFFMISSDDPTGGKTLSSSFRGRILKGLSLELPPDYEGMIIKRDNEQEHGDGETRDYIPRTMSVVGKFPAFTYWNREVIPSDSDRQQMLMRWLHLAKQLHDPHSPADMLDKPHSINWGSATNAEILAYIDERRKVRKIMSSLPSTLSADATTAPNSPSVGLKRPAPTVSPRRSPRKRKREGE